MPSSSPLEARSRDHLRLKSVGRVPEDSVVVDTHDLEHWANAIWDTYGALHIVPDAGQPLACTLIRRDFDHLKSVELLASPQAVHRTASLVNNHPNDDLVVSMFVQGEGLLGQDGRSCALGPGEFAFMESARPYSMMLRRPCRVIEFVWPRSAIGLSEAESYELTARVIGPTSPISRWLSPMLIGFHEMDSGISDAAAIRLANGMADLIVTAALELSDPGEADVRLRQQYDDIIRFIKRNLDDPDLSAESIANAFFMSTRTVHRVFARFGNTVAVVIRDLRLETCRQMMLSRAHRNKSISYLSSQFGFSSLQVFSRAFTAKYGTAPKQYRSSRS